MFFFVKKALVVGLVFLSGVMSAPAPTPEKAELAGKKPKKHHFKVTIGTFKDETKCNQWDTNKRHTIQAGKCKSFDHFYYFDVLATESQEKKIPYWDNSGTCRLAVYSDKHCNLEVWSETPVNTRGYMTSGCHSVGAKAKSVNIVCEDYWGLPVTKAEMPDE